MSNLHADGDAPCATRSRLGPAPPRRGPYRHSLRAPLRPESRPVAAIMLPSLSGIQKRHATDGTRLRRSARSHPAVALQRSRRTFRRRGFLWCSTAQPEDATRRGGIRRALDPHPRVRCEDLHATVSAVSHPWPEVARSSTPEVARGLQMAKAAVANQVVAPILGFSRSVVFAACLVPHGRTTLPLGFVPSTPRPGPRPGIIGLFGSNGPARARAAHPVGLRRPRPVPRPCSFHVRAEGTTLRRRGVHARSTACRPTHANDSWADALLSGLPASRPGERAASPRHVGL